MLESDGNVTTPMTMTRVVLILPWPVLDSMNGDMTATMTMTSCPRMTMTMANDDDDDLCCSMIW